MVHSDLLPIATPSPRTAPTSETARAVASAGLSRAHTTARRGLAARRRPIPRRVAPSGTRVLAHADPAGLPCSIRASRSAWQTISAKYGSASTSMATPNAGLAASRSSRPCSKRSLRSRPLRARARADASSRSPTCPAAVALRWLVKQWQVSERLEASERGRGSCVLMATTKPLSKEVPWPAREGRVCPRRSIR